MSHVTFFKQNAHRNKKVKSRYSLIPPIKIGPATLGVITLVIIMLMSLLYLVQANLTATKGYEIENEQERIKKLESQAEKLELEMAKLRSTKEIDKIPQELNLVPTPQSNEIGSIQFFEQDKAMAGVDSKNEGLIPKR